MPTSGHTGEGICDILAVLIKYTSKYLKKQLTVNTANFHCNIMEVKMIDGLGTTVDCVLASGVLKKNDKICFAGVDGPIKTKIRALLTPHPMKEIRIKGEYLHHDV